LRDSGARVLLVYNGATGTAADVLCERDGEVVLDRVIAVALGDCSGAQIPGPALDARMSYAETFAAVLAEGKNLPFEAVALEGGDPLFLQYTGGTTGVSKGAVLSHRNLVANVQQYKAVVASTLRPGEDVIVTAIPLYHIFALMVNFISYFSVGAENWLVLNPRDSESFIEVLKKSRCTVITGVNTLFASLIAHPRIAEVDFSRLRMSAGGGAAIVEAVSSKWQKLTGVFIREGYGLSETSPMVTFNTDQANGFNGTTGVPLPSTDIRLINDAGLAAAPGEAGEVCVKGPQVMVGYWEKAAANALAFTSDGYFRTGDVGVLTEEGLLKIVDRKKDMIIVSGFNVFPNEVEAVATACVGVQECACVGVPDEKTGEALRLFVVKAPGAAVDARALDAHCR
jgi:long-chain acyl-CoA synthetase